MNKVHLDFETYCEQDIKKVGAWRYSVDPSLDIICLMYVINDGSVKWWRPYEDDELPYELFDAIEDGYFIHAWNVSFEYSVWENHCIPKLGFPEVPKISWFDSAAKAAMHSLPFALDDCCKALKIPAPYAKLATGAKLIDLLCSPNKKTGKRVTKLDAPKSYMQMYDYCVNDVVAERYIDDFLLDLKPFQRDSWHIDQVINRRGILIDIPNVQKIAKRVEEQTLVANSRLPALTKNVITKVTQVQRIRKFANECGINIKDCTAQTIDKVLDFVEKNPTKVKDKHKPALEVLEIRKWFGKAATSKYIKMLEVADPNTDRVYFTLLFHGAHTGRWAGRLVQPHNLFKPTISKYCNPDHFVEAVANRPIDCIEAVYQPFIHAAASATRMMLRAADDHIFYVGDYNAIEARYAFWIADDEAGLDYYRKGIDPYCAMATKVFNRVITKADEFERFIGKGLVLGANFGLGWRGFMSTMKDQWGVEIEESIAKKGIAAHRDTHFMVVKKWDSIEKNCLDAIRNPGEVFSEKYLRFLKPDNCDFLYIQLPSGRLLAYPEPRIREKKTPWGVVKETFSYKAFDKTKGGWYTEYTYGGKTFENIVQGGAYDLMMHGMTELEFQGFPVTFTVHDELILELPVKTAKRDQEKVTKILETPAAWANGMLIMVEAELTPRYRKI